MKKNRNTKSFKALLLIALGMGILSACCVPGVRKTPNAAQVEDTSAVQEDKTLKKEDISNENVMMDTVYGDWHVRIDIIDSKTKVKNSDEFVKKLVVTISKGGKVLFDKKVFTREDIWKGADEEFQVYAALVSDVTNTSVYLPVSICYPETDDGFTVWLALSKDGSSTVYPVPIAWDESDIVTDFYIDKESFTDSDLGRAREFEYRGIPVKIVHKKSAIDKFFINLKVKRNDITDYRCFF